MNRTGQIASTFVKNGKLTLLIALTMGIWGIMGFFNTPRQYNPRIVAPAFHIMVEFPGASQEEVLEHVTRPLENVISDIPEVDDIFSVTRAGGMAALNVNFYVGGDFEKAKTTLADRITSHMDMAPDGIKDPLIQSIDPDDVPVAHIALMADDPVELRRFAFDLRNKLALVDGATNIQVVGGRRREFLVSVTPERLAARNVGIGEIIMALERQNIFMPAGTIKNPDGYIPVELHGTVQSREDLASLSVVTGDIARTVLSDVASVSETVEEIDDYVRHVTQEVDPGDGLVLVSIAKSRDANISDVTEALQDSLVRLNEIGFVPDHIDVEMIVDEGRVAQEEISGLVRNLLTSVTIVVLILVLFLNFRAALLVAIAIPLTLATVFGIAWVTGQNINRITLFALILSLGMLVDSATVVIENIVRRMGLAESEGKDISDSEVCEDTAIDAVNEVGPGLFMSTVTTILAFVPMAFVTGMMGPYMGPIPFFLPVALIVSLFLAFSVNPYFASYFLRHSSRTAQKTIAMPVFITFLSAHFSELGRKIFSRYRLILHKILTRPKVRNRTLISVLALIIICFSLPMTGLVKFRMLPKADREQFFLYVDLPDGTPLQTNLEITKFLENELLQEDEVTMTQSFIGHPPILDFNGLFRGVSERQESHQTTIRVGLSHPDTRRLMSEELVLDYRQAINSRIPQLFEDRPGQGPIVPAGLGISENDIKLKFVEDPPGPPVLSTVLLRVQSEKEDLNRQIANDLMPFVNTVDEVVDTDDSVPVDRQQLSVYVDHARASAARIGVDDIMVVLRTLYDGHQAGVYHHSETKEQEFIVVRLDEASRQSPESINRVSIMNDRGIKVPLGQLVDFRYEDASKSIRRENLKNTVYIYGEMAERSVTYASIDMLVHLFNYEPPGGGERIGFNLFGATYLYPDGTTVDINLGGEWELTLEVFRDLGIAMGVAIFLIYVVLVAQFGSYREPLVILSTIPLSLIGVLPGFFIMFYINGLYFTATSMIGVIALAGLAVNNSIILLHYLNSMKDSGLPLEEALVEAGVTRFRPIMLTTVTTMLGSMTIIQDPVWAGLAYAIVLGLGVSSLLTLIVFPALFQLLLGKKWPGGCLIHGTAEPTEES